MISTQTMVSTQPICVCSPLRLPQPRLGIPSAVSLHPPLRKAGGLKWSSSGFQKGGGHRTSAVKQGSSPSFSSAEDASRHGVPAKAAAAAHHAPGTKTVELMDPFLPTKLVDDQLPPLLSIITNDLPPFQMAKDVDEAKERLHQYAKRFSDITSLYSYFRVGLSTTAYVHAGVINIDRLVVMSINYALWFALDDLFFDMPNEFLLDDYNISRSICGSPEKIQEYLDYLDAIFAQEIQPSNHAPSIEILIWESGRDMLELSNTEWFNHYVTCVKICHKSSADSQADIIRGRKLWSHDLELYAFMRAGNSGGAFAQMLIEFAKDTYIPNILRTNPYFENLTFTTSVHLGFVNDVFSYPKEILLEENPRNLITVLKECKGKPFVETVHMAIGMIHTYTRRILNLESQAWNSTLQNHLQEIKSLIAGNVYYCLMEKRYHHPDSIFPELRDATGSWKIHFHAQGVDF